MPLRPRSCRGPRGSAALLGLLTLFLHLPVEPAKAQTPAEMIRDFAVTASGFTLRGEVDEGSLRAGRQRGFSVEFLEGVEYMVVGFCNSDCPQLDLAILDPSGEEFGSDDLPDARPVLIFTPEVSGRHHITVDMVSCSVEPCLYAVGILERDPGKELREDFALLWVAKIPSAGRVLAFLGSGRAGVDVGLGTDRGVERCFSAEESTGSPA